jgi:hypothetical protein
MKVKTSSTLLEEIDRANTNRSAFLEHAAPLYLDRRERHRGVTDAEILNWNAERLNRKAAYILEYRDLPE